MKQRSVEIAENAAAERLRDAFREDPDSLAFVGLAHILLQGGEYDEAILVCREGLSHHPNHSTGHLILGLALEEKGDEREAIRSLQEVIDLDPGNRIAVQHLGDAYRRAGESAGGDEKKTSPPEPKEPAEETDRIDLDLGQEIAFFTFSMAEVYEKQGFFEKALAIYQRVLTLQPHRDDVRGRIRDLKRKTSAA